MFGINLVNFRERIHVMSIYNDQTLNIYSLDLGKIVIAVVVTVINSRAVSPKLLRPATSFYTSSNLKLYDLGLDFPLVLFQSNYCSCKTLSVHYIFFSFFYFVGSMFLKCSAKHSPYFTFSRIN